MKYIVIPVLFATSSYPTNLSDSKLHKKALHNLPYMLAERFCVNYEEKLPIIPRQLDHNKRHNLPCNLVDTLSIQQVLLEHQLPALVCSKFLLDILELLFGLLDCLFHRLYGSRDRVSFEGQHSLLGHQRGKSSGSIILVTLLH